MKFQIAYNQKLTGSTDRDCDTAAAGESEQSTVQTTETTTSPSGTTQPSAGTTQPSVGTTQPSAETTQPTAGTTQPTAGTTQPTAGTTQPPNDGSTEITPNGRSRKRPFGRGVHNDYLLIPDGFYSSSRFASKYCDKSLENIDDSTGNCDRNIFFSILNLIIESHRYAIRPDVNVPP